MRCLDLRQCLIIIQKTSLITSLKYFSVELHFYVIAIISVITVKKMRQSRIIHETKKRVEVFRRSTYISRILCRVKYFRIHRGISTKARKIRWYDKLMHHKPISIDRMSGSMIGPVKVQKNRHLLMKLMHERESANKCERMSETD